MKVALYAGVGVSPFSLQQTRHALEEQLPTSSLFFVDETYFYGKGWEKGTDLLVFPGGRDLLYQKKLQGHANERIRNYVAQGGRYLGICAGAYYASSAIEFEKGGELEVIGSRELSFFPGKAVGPALGAGFFRYESSQGARAAQVHCNEGQEHFLYYNGGCYFEDAHSQSLTQVIATYGDTKKPAMILCHGRALLSGVHFEYNAHALDSTDPHLQALLPYLKQGEAKRKALLRRCLDLLQSV